VAQHLGLVLLYWLVVAGLFAGLSDEATQNSPVLLIALLGWFAFGGWRIVRKRRIR